MRFTCFLRLHFWDFVEGKGKVFPFVNDFLDSVLNSLLYLSGGSLERQG